MTLRTLIVDDEPLARERLKLMLEAEPALQIVAECKNGIEALAFLRAETVDLLFLDVQMPRLSGIEVAREIGIRHLPPTIFVTAYQEHAVQAFELEAVDYLTKPIELPRLKQALKRAHERAAAKIALLTHDRLNGLLNRLHEATKEPQSYAQRLLVRDGQRDLLLPVDSIEWIEAADYYSSLHVKERTFLLRKSIAELADKLDPATFVRVHRSAIVNLNHVREIYREGPEEGSLILSKGQRVRVSKSGRQRLVAVGRSSGRPSQR
jgi:two-component system, LytTR family, response regulator